MLSSLTVHICAKTREWARPRQTKYTTHSARTPVSLGSASGRQATFSFHPLVVRNVTSGHVLDTQSIRVLRQQAPLPAPAGAMRRPAASSCSPWWTTRRGTCAPSWGTRRFWAPRSSPFAALTVTPGAGPDPWRFPQPTLSPPASSLLLSWLLQKP